MNRFSRCVVFGFRSPANKQKLYAALVHSFPCEYHQAVTRILDEQMDVFINAFAVRMEQEFKSSEPLDGTTPETHLRHINVQFVHDRHDFILRYILGVDGDTNDGEMSMWATSAPPIAFTVDDGKPVSQYGSRYWNRGANAILDDWRMNAARGVQFRDDPAPIGGMTAADRTKCESGGARRHGEQPAEYFVPDSVNKRCVDPGVNEARRGGITFSDQSAIGTSQHYDQLFGRKYVQAMNTWPLYNGAVGWSTPESDERLLRRRVMNSDESCPDTRLGGCSPSMNFGPCASTRAVGSEGGARRYEKRLYKRNLDRDITESLRNTEHLASYRQGGYDMSSLYKRVDMKRKN